MDMITLVMCIKLMRKLYSLYIGSTPEGTGTYICKGCPFKFLRDSLFAGRWGSRGVLPRRWAPFTAECQWARGDWSWEYLCRHGWICCCCSSFHCCWPIGCQSFSCRLVKSLYCCHGLSQCGYNASWADCGCRCGWLGKRLTWRVRLRSLQHQ